MKKILASILMLTMLLGLSACGSKETAPAETGSAAVEEDDENYATGDASLDDPRNADEIGENELLVVSFGTSFNDSRRLTIGGIEGALAEAFPDWSVRRGFTSQIIIDHVKNRDGVEIDNVTAALDRAVENGVKALVVQPTHLMHGYEYNDLKDELAGYADAFDQIVMGEPLLTSDEDFAAVADIIVNASPTRSMRRCSRCSRTADTPTTSSAPWRPSPPWRMCWPWCRRATISASCSVRS